MEDRPGLVEDGESWLKNDSFGVRASRAAGASTGGVRPIGNSTTPPCRRAGPPIRTARVSPDSGRRGAAGVRGTGRRDVGGRATPDVELVHFVLMRREPAQGNPRPSSCGCILPFVR